MKVDSGSDYKLIFSISVHPYLGAVIDPCVVQLTGSNTLSLTYQKVFSGNATYYEQISEEELSLIKMLDSVRIEQLVKKFSPVDKIRPKEYFQKFFKRDEFRDTIRPYIEGHLVDLLRILPEGNDLLYLADDVNPAAEPVDISQDFATVLFHFRRTEEGSRYFATVRHQDERIQFMKSGSLLLSNQPAFLVAQSKLLRFFDFVEGGKLNVFVNKKFVLIKREQEEEYYRTFIRKLLERYPVYAQGFKILTEKRRASVALVLHELNEDEARLSLETRYGDWSFEYHPTKYFHVHFDWNDAEPVFTKIKRSFNWEETKVGQLMELGLRHEKDEFFKYGDNKLFEWIHWLRKNSLQLKELDFEIRFDKTHQYNLDVPRLDYKVDEERDWFDLKITVKIGEEEYPFRRFLSNIRNGDRLFKLKNGELFLIPEAWFAIGEKLQRFKQESNFRLSKFQLDILDVIPHKKVSEHLKELVHIKEEKPSKKFKGTLRPYQLEGLSWLTFLFKNRFGGILADDMGLGKTVQTLAFIQNVLDMMAKEDKPGPVLLVAPTSLLFNWQSEAARFTPKLKTHIHNGPQRFRASRHLMRYDLLITSYGLVRNDFELFSEIQFLYLVLDESQNIKNRNTKSTQLINRLEADHRLCLTGTPIENSVKDLWSQMNFLNRGLLGSSRHFEDHFVKPIEKLKDPERTEDLSRLVKPFVLRRTKQQVARDLPDLSEKTIICPMNSDQEQFYEKIKSEYRNKLLNLVEEQGMDKSRMSILQGLTKLRQIANHPGLVDKTWNKGSGKHKLLLEYIKTALDEHHKVLVFSQFVSYLEILEQDLKRLEVAYLKLTGTTNVRDRKFLVEQFQETDDFPLFLISLKAGGTGLNLTAADYVFLVDPWWNPAVEAQARDRTHRIGQQNKVFSYKFISASTVEEKIVHLQKNKKRIAQEVIQIEENVIKTLGTKEVSELFS